jgi:REP element-mobilizing transposase RayT
MARTLTCLLTHIVFSTKDREPLIDADLRERLWPYVGGIIRHIGGKAVAVGGMADHVHLLVELPPALPVAEAVRKAKANSSRWIRGDGARSPIHSKFGWQAGYSAFSVSRSSRKAVFDYITAQEAHHKRLGFCDELKALLARHEIAYDERYAFD